MEYKDEDQNDFESGSGDENQKEGNTFKPFFWGEQTDVIFEEFRSTYIRIDTSIETNPELQLINGWSNIISINEGAQIIGYLHFKIYNSYFIRPSELLSVANSFSSEEYFIMSSFMKHFQKEMKECYLKLLVVSEISLNDDYLNKGLEMKVLIELISLCRILEVDYILLKPYSTFEEKFGSAIRKNKKQAVKLAVLRNKLVFDVYYFEEDQPVIVLDIRHI